MGGGLGPGNRDFFGPCEMASSRLASAIWGPKSYISRATVPLISRRCQDKERKDEEDDDEDDDKGDDEERRRKKKTRTVFSRSQVSLLHYFSSFVQ